MSPGLRWRRLQHSGLVAVLILVLGASARQRPSPPDLGRWADRVPMAPLVLIAPSLSSAAHALRPLFDRLGLALPDLDPARQFVEWRVRLGLDPWDPASFEAAGLDATGPLAMLDDGALAQPVLLLGLLPDGLPRFERNVVARVVERERLLARHEHHAQGVQAQGLAVADDADPRLAYAVDGNLLALAPWGCSRDLAPVLQALRPRGRLLQDQLARSVLAGLPSGELVLLATRATRTTSPFSSARQAAADLEVAAVSLRVQDKIAIVVSQALPTDEGAQRMSRFPALRGAAARQVRRLGALSLWTGLERSAAVPQAWPYAAQLRQAADAQGIALERELSKLVDGGVGWHLFDLEPLLPGLTEQRAIDAASAAFFVEHALTAPLKPAANPHELLARLDAWLAGRGGQLVAAEGTEARGYSERGRVVEYGVVDGALVASSGPGTLAQLRGVLGEPGETVAEGTLFALRADAPSMRALLGRVGLLGAGDNNDLRAVWAARQAMAPLLVKLGALRADLRRHGELLRLDASAELIGPPTSAATPGDRGGPLR